MLTEADRVKSIQGLCNVRICCMPSCAVLTKVSFLSLSLSLFLCPSASFSQNKP